MHSFKLFFAFITLVVIGSADAAIYHNIERLSGQSFLDAFSWVAIHDPTKGRVDYVNKSTAQSHGLYSVSENTVTLRADNKTVLDPRGPGRKSFRLQSNNRYHQHVAIFDIAHMPEGCGTWPAGMYFHDATVFVSPTSLLVYREVGDNWPNNGEIDIVEGINNRVPNQSTLHTSAGCRMSSRNMTGQSKGNNCNVYATNNQGCGVLISDKDSFGPNFNKNNGGWYAVERSKTHIAIYFWGRKDSSVPNEVKTPRGSVDTSTWGTPAAYFPNTDCHFASHFGPMHIIINLTFCGIWAGNVYSSSGCPSTCIEYVNNNPGAFTNAYFKFNSLSIYH